MFAIDDRRVLRRYRDGGDVAAEAAVMAYVAGLGFPAPTVYEARGADLVLDRLDGPTMLAALECGLDVAEAAKILADLHRRLHALPPRRSADPAERVLHLDLHPGNVLMTARGPVVVDWRNSSEGAADLDVAMSALILAQVAADPAEVRAGAAGALLGVFVAEAGPIPVAALAAAAARRARDVALSVDEVARLPAAVALITGAGGPIRP